MSPERDMSDTGKEKMEADLILSDDDSVYNGTHSWLCVKNLDSLKRATKSMSTWTSLTRITIWMPRIMRTSRMISMPMP